MAATLSNFPLLVAHCGFDGSSTKRRTARPIIHLRSQGTLFHGILAGFSPGRNIGAKNSPGVISKVICQAAPALNDNSYKMRVPFELKKGQIRGFHRLSSGLNMEFIFQKGFQSENGKPPLVFVHGSFHAAWCWAEYWLPFFSRNGFDCYALSLLGQGESDSPSASVAGTLQTHAADVASFIENEIQFPPVLFGHSFGGLIVQYYLANLELNSEDKGLSCSHPRLAGSGLICSVPPSGNGGLVWRYLFSNPIAAFKVTRSLAAKAFQTSLPLCKETFFSSAMDDSLVLRYQRLMTESSRMTLFDLRKLNASLPVPSVKNPSIKILVMGANNDFIVDAEGLDETASFYNVSPVCIEGVAHDMMLDCSWERGAEAILSWLNALSVE